MSMIGLAARPGTAVDPMWCQCHAWHHIGQTRGLSREPAWPGMVVLNELDGRVETTGEITCRRCPTCVGVAFRAHRPSFAHNRRLTRPMRGTGDRTRSAASEISTSASGLGSDHARSSVRRQPVTRYERLLPTPT